LSACRLPCGPLVLRPAVSSSRSGRHAT
jgi:hypothetical protein